MLLLVMGAATVLNNVVKLAFVRARPEAFFGERPTASALPAVMRCFRPATSASSPALIAAHVASGWQRGVVWVLACSIIAGIGLSRVYLGVHYLTDVIAGSHLRHSSCALCAASSQSSAEMRVSAHAVSQSLELPAQWVVAPSSLAAPSMPQGETIDSVPFRLLLHCCSPLRRLHRHLRPIRPRSRRPTRTFSRAPAASRRPARTACLTTSRALRSRRLRRLV